MALLASFARAIGLSLRRGNLVRVCVLGFITIVPTLIASVLRRRAHRKRGGAHVDFWANASDRRHHRRARIAAMQTAFALDFAGAGAADDRR